MERLHSALILKTPMYHPNEAHIIEHTHELFYETIIHNHTAQMVQMIIEGFDVDFHELGKTPPLIFAIKYNKKEIIETLLMYGADVNVQDKDGNTPLLFAVKFEHYLLLTALLKYGADAHISNHIGQSAFNTASTQALELLTSTNALVNITPHNIFELARLGDLNRLVHSLRPSQQLLQTNSEGQSLLHLAVLSNNMKTVIYLLNKGLNIDAEDDEALTPLIIAMSHVRYLDLAILLLNRHATLEHVSSKGHSALTVSIRNNNPQGAMLLIKRGANINIADSAHTPLTLTHSALLQYHKNVEQYRELETLLLSKGAKVDVRLNSLHWTPLCTTVTKVENKENTFHIKLLVQLGADVNHRDLNSRTPLMLAASMGRKNAIKILLDNYASSHLFDNYGWSALMFAVFYNHQEAVTFMLESGVDPNIVSPQGLSALKIAQEHKRIAMVDILLEYGAIATNEET